MGFFNPFLKSGEGGGGSGGTTDYRQLSNKPFINGVMLNGDLSSKDLYIIDAKTTAQWDATPSLISKENAIYVYTDHSIVDGKNIPAIKIGDGISYVKALPFLAGSSINITQEQIDSWNNKITAYRDEFDEENLVLSF